MTFRHHIYRRLGQNKAEFLKRVQAIAREVAVPGELHGAIGLTGSNSARPAYLRPDIIAKMGEGARSPKNIVTYVEEIRDVVKEGYGDDFDALPINTRVNPYTLREITDDSGGRTEVVHDSSDLETATARIADELNHQYVLAYTSARAPDGQYHSIRVRVTRPDLRVRARRGGCIPP